MIKPCSFRAPVMTRKKNGDFCSACTELLNLRETGERMEACAASKDPAGLNAIAFISEATPREERNGV